MASRLECLGDVVNRVLGAGGGKYHDVGRLRRTGNQGHGEQHGRGKATEQDAHIDLLLS